MSDTAVNRILEQFREIAAIPRPSKHEKRIVEHVLAWAANHGFQAKQDEANNVAVFVPGRGQAKNRSPVVLQGHLDMVCESSPETEHDCASDPIVPIVEGDWIRAEGTSLGADNGIAVALSMALATDDSLSHPPLELLFTVDEETGLNGAKRLKGDFVTGRRLINIDSETEGTFTVGCAGGQDTTISLSVERGAPPSEGSFYELSIAGLPGGHSGVDIDKPIGNANKVLARALAALIRNAEIRLVDIRGGSAHNAIARDSSALFHATESDPSPLLTRLQLLTQKLRGEYEEENLSVTVKAVSEPSERPMTREATATVVNLLVGLPHGVDRMSSKIAGLVETSSNLATVRTEASRVTILTSQRSSLGSRLEAITGRINAVAGLAGAECENTDGYPAWEPDLDSPLLARATRTYRDLFSTDPEVDVIHAGLECGVIGSVYPEMDMISLGPTIRGAHSPDERLHIGSLSRIWTFLVAILSKVDD